MRSGGRRRGRGEGAQGYRRGEGRQGWYLQRQIISDESTHAQSNSLPSSSAPSACGKLLGLSAILEYPLLMRCFLLGGGGCSGTLLLAGRLGGRKVRGVFTGVPTQQEIHHVINTTPALTLTAWVRCSLIPRGWFSLLLFRNDAKYNTNLSSHYFQWRGFGVA